MNRLRTIRIGICSNGPIICSSPTKPEWKFIISICNCDKQKHEYLINCKTTSKNQDNLWPGEFIIDDLFGRGQTKVCPYNLFRVPIPDLSSFKYIGTLDEVHMPKFQTGLQIAIKKNLFTPPETLEIMDSWQPFF